MDDAKQQLVDKLKTANNILVTVSRDPTVDQLASCLGLALLLNKQGKHTAAVFSGHIPSTLEFLQPEETLEKNTDSLRDFIIALDKSKADKLRYKVEDNVVRIFITPYKTSIGQDDLEFSQGDFNVGVVVALGVGKQEDLDEAITAHGRILHDATVASLNLSPDGGLGSINWYDPKASSLSELVTDLAKALDPTLLDGQIATALLTGIVSATERFRNDKTSSQTMSASATLMAAGANQQLVASKLEEPEQPDSPDDSDDDDDNKDDKDDGDKPDDGTIEIDHENNEPADDAAIELPEPDDDTSDPPADEPQAAEPAPPPPPPAEIPPAPASNLPGTLSSGSKLITDAPILGGTLTANSQPAALDPVTDPMSMPTTEPPQLLDHKPEPPADFTPPPSDWTPPPPAPEPDPVPPPAPQPDQPGPTLSDLEEEVKASEEQAKDEAGGLNTARDEVDRAINTSQSSLPPKPIEALNAQPLGDDLHPVTPVNPPSNDVAQINDPTAPPPVPPPIPFQFGSPNPPQQ